MVCVVAWLLLPLVVKGARLLEDTSLISRSILHSLWLLSCAAAACGERCALRHLTIMRYDLRYALENILIFLAISV